MTTPAPEEVNATNDVGNHYESDISDAMLITTFVISAIMSCIGALGNTLAIAAIILHKKLRAVHNVFIINLAVTDLLVNLITGPFAIVGAITRGSFFHERGWFCEFLAVLNIMCCAASIGSILSIAVERYIIICYNHKHAQIYNRVTIPFYVAVIWLYAFLMDMPNYQFIGWSRHYFDPETLVCSWDLLKAHASGYMWYLYVCCYGVPLPVMILCFCYIRIYSYARKSSFNSSGCESATKIKSADKLVLKMVLRVMIVFNVMWSPYAAAVMLVGYIDVPVWVMFLSSYMVWANSSINFIIYAFSKDFRDAYIIVKNTLLGRKIVFVQQLPNTISTGASVVNS